MNEDETLLVSGLEVQIKLVKFIPTVMFLSYFLSFRITHSSSNILKVERRACKGRVCQKTGLKCSPLHSVNLKRESATVTVG